VSFGEPIALRGQVDLEQVASATPGDVRSAPELQFIEQLKTGDLGAFDKLVADRSGEIYGLLYRLTEDSEEARDLTQETFLRAFQNIARFRGDSDLKTWLYRIAINQARNRWRWWRRRRKDVTVSIDAETDDGIPALANSLVADGGNNPERESLARERETLLRSALRSLAPNYREAVVLRDIQGLTYEEIATALEITVGTVKSRISRGRDELRKRLDGMF
jgi:RNA polymerase sigma-70 factor (ECF subfamily)